MFAIMTPNASRLQACRFALDTTPGENPDRAQDASRIQGLLPARRWGPKHPFAVSVLCVLLALPIKLAFDALVPEAPSTILFLFPVIIAAWYGGLGPGLLATVLSFPICFFFFLPDRGSLTVPHPDDGIRLFLFLVESVLISVLSGSLHQARERIRTRAAEVHLEQEIQVAERTAELAKANHALECEIAQRNQMQEAIAREREFLVAILQNIGDGVVACDADERLTLFNRASEQFLGGLVQPISVADRARHYGLFKPDGTTLLTTDELPLHRAWKGEVVQDAELVIVSGTGEPRSILSSGQPLLNARGEKLGAVVVMRSITERKRPRNTSAT